MNTGTRACANSQPDGYTICITNADAMLYNQFLFKKPAVRSRAPACSRSPMPFTWIHMLVVNSQLGVKTSRDSSRCRRRKAGTLSYLAPGPASRSVYGDAEEREGQPTGSACRSRGGGEAVNAIMSGTTPIAPVWRGQCDRQRPAPAQMTPLVMMNNIRSPNFPQVPLLEGDRVRRQAVAELVWDFRAGRHTEGDRRARSPRTSTRS